jgi:hypothetical protein
MARLWTCKTSLRSTAGSSARRGSSESRNASSAVLGGMCSTRAGTAHACVMCARVWLSCMREQCLTPLGFCSHPACALGRMQRSSEGSNRAHH